METYSDIETINKKLSSFEGLKCVISLCSKTHRRIALNIETKEVDKIIYIIGAGCLYISGPIDFVIKMQN